MARKAGAFAPAVVLVAPCEKKRGDVMPTTGEKPGVGVYRCTKCGNTLTLDDPTDKLPPCAQCNGTNFVKIA